MARRPPSTFVIASQRHSIILKTINEVGFVKTAHLAKQFNVSDETIRTDIIELFSKGLIKKIHGGAAAVHPPDVKNVPSKQRLIDSDLLDRQSHAALKLIKKTPGTVFIDDAPLGIAMCQKIFAYNSTLATNNPDLLLFLANLPKASFCSTGGQFYSAARRFIGPDAINSPISKKITQAFLIPDKFNPLDGVCYNNPLMAEFNASFFPESTKVCVIIRSEHILTSTINACLPIKQVTHLITDKKISEPLIKMIAKAKIKLIII